MKIGEIEKNEKNLKKYLQWDVKCVNMLWQIKKRSSAEPSYERLIKERKCNDGYFEVYHTGSAQIRPSRT